MADELCFVTVVFKSSERTTVFMDRATLDQFTADYANSSSSSHERKIYPLTDLPSNASPQLSPRVLAVALADIAYIA